MKPPPLTLPKAPPESSAARPTGGISCPPHLPFPHGSLAWRSIILRSKPVLSRPRSSSTSRSASGGSAAKNVSSSTIVVRRGGFSISRGRTSRRDSSRGRSNRPVRPSTRRRKESPPGSPGRRSIRPNRGSRVRKAGFPALRGSRPGTSPRLLRGIARRTETVRDPQVRMDGRPPPKLSPSRDNGRRRRRPGGRR